MISMEASKAGGALEPGRSRGAMIDPEWNRRMKGPKRVVLVLKEKDSMQVCLERQKNLKILRSIILLSTKGGKGRNSRKIKKQYNERYYLKIK